MSEPQLAPPGAGLPFHENIIARLLLATHRFVGNSDAFVANFVRERGIIRDLIRPCDADTLSRRVLIARPRGLEDSSRDWSVLMTLDHLKIVHHSIIGVMESLSDEKMPAGKASTAAVKPDPTVTDAVREAYEESCDKLLATIGRIRNLRTRTRFPHPWFGPMDAHGWCALVGSHMRIHRVQIERILK